MSTMLKKKDWSTHTRRALTATEVVANLAKLEGWTLTGDGAHVAIEKTYQFANYYETISFVNALAQSKSVAEMPFTSCVFRRTTQRL